MSIDAPKIVLRIGSHAEKEYFEKLAPLLDAMMFGGNLLEITPTATASLLALLKMIRGDRGAIPYYLDPMTYCFGPYIDPFTKKVRIDLDALKSTRKNRKTKVEFTAVKDSYASLARRLGPSFEAAVGNGVACKAINPSAIPDQDRDSFCKGVLAYQLERIEQIIAAELPVDDDVMRQAFDGIGKPAAVFAPYFFISELWADAGLKIAIELARRSAAQEPGPPVHAIICASNVILRSDEQIKYLVEELPKTGIQGVWLWFDGFDECEPAEQLAGDTQAVRTLVRGLSGKMQIFNLHGGYFSMLLAHDGLTGISHGVGYGEQKAVGQVIGAAAPTVRYYLPPICRRVGVAEIQRCFKELGIETAEHFYEKICRCQICKGVIGNDLTRFSSFGEMHRANSESKKDTQTPAAAKICRFHFLLNRLAERQTVARLDAENRSQHVTERVSSWRGCAALAKYLGQPGTDGYAEVWAKTLSPK